MGTLKEGCRSSGDPADQQRLQAEKSRVEFVDEAVLSCSVDYS